MKGVYAMKTRELRDKRAQILERLSAIVDIADKENRSMDDGEVNEYNELMRQVSELDAEIERREKIEQAMSQNASQRAAVIGMGEKDLRQYSLLRAIRAAATGDWRGAELEREASEATAKKVGRDPQGFFVPQDWLESRDLVKGTPASGGYLVATDLLAQSFIDLLRNRMMVQRAGATVLGGLVGDIAIPKQTGGATAYWVAESGSPTESQQSVGQVPMAPKTVGAFTDISRKLLKQSSIDVEAFVRRDLATVLALAIDFAALHGTGTSNQPTGIANTSGIGSVVGGTDGAAPTWEHIVKLETEVAIDNADIGALAYMTNAKVRGKLKTTPRTPTYGDIMVWERNDTPLNGYPAYVTNQVRSNLDKGTSTGVCSAIFFGNWNDLLIGMWGGLDILVDPYTGSTSGTLRIVALQDVDIAVRNPESFAAMLDALTT
jgi:HK97 family phage major capsid protein